MRATSFSPDIIKKPKSSTTSVRRCDLSSPFLHTTSHTPYTTSHTPYTTSHTPSPTSHTSSPTSPTPFPHKPHSFPHYSPTHLPLILDLLSYLFSTYSPTHSPLTLLLALHAYPKLPPTDSLTISPICLPLSTHCLIISTIAAEGARRPLQGTLEASDPSTLPLLTCISAFPRRIVQLIIASPFLDITFPGLHCRPREFGFTVAAQPHAEPHGHDFPFSFLLC